MATISIIMPVYNKESTVSRAIESVLNQTYKKFELIIVNDGSIDNSEDIILSYKRKDHRIIYLKQKNKGVAVARNVGIDNSKLKYISFLDADDQIDNLFLEKMISTIGKSNVCYCSHYDVFGDKKIKSNLDFSRNDILNAYLYNKCTPNTNSWLIKKVYLNQFKIRFSSGINWGEDMEFFSKVLLHDTNIKCVKEPLSYYYKGQENSLSKNNLDKIYKDIYWMKQVIEYINNHESNYKRKVEAIQAIESYRLPAAIIYRLYSNLNIVDKSILRDKMCELENYVNKIDLYNGLRSVKLYYIYYRLKLKLR